jgi:hypothetical protein
MAQSSGSTQPAHGQRKPFQAGDIFGNQPNREPYVLVTPAHTDMFINTPYAMKSGGAKQNQNPFGWVEGTSGQKMEMSKAPLPRNSTGNSRKSNGTHGY